MSQPLKMETVGAAIRRRRLQLRTVRDVIDLYLAQARRDLPGRHFDGVARTLGQFAESFGQVEIEDLRPFDLQCFLNDRPQLRSEWTIRRAVASIKRAFNYCVEVGLLRYSPIAGFRSRGRTPHGGRRPMSEAEFQCLMRASAPTYRRFLIFLKFTGCRPGEAGGLRWEEVHLEKCQVALLEHKTARRTDRPRIIPLVPPLVKMLVWMKQRRQTTTVELVERLLLTGPVTGVELARYLSHYGASYRAAARAREALGVIRTREGGDGPKGHYVYSLPDRYVRRIKPGERDFVFQTCLGYPLNRCNLSNYMHRARKRAGLPKGVTLYGLRHRFGTLAVKNNVSLKLLAMLLGHVDTKMSEAHYVHEASLAQEVEQAALQVAWGPGAMLLRPGAAPRPVPAVEAPPAAEIPVVFEHLPRLTYTGRRPDIPAGVPPADGAEQPLEAALCSLMRRLSARKARRPTSSRVVLMPCHRAAFQALTWATDKRPELAAAADRKVYEFLRHRPDCPFKVPPTFATFARHLGSARFFQGVRKREGVGQARQPASSAAAEAPAGS